MVTQNVASPELCEQVYKELGWKGTYWNYWRSKISNEWVLSHVGAIETREVKERIPAYDLGFLFDTLPREIKLEDGYYALSIMSVHDKWRGAYGGGKYKKFLKQTKLPADVLCKVALELKKAGILV